MEELKGKLTEHAEYCKLEKIPTIVELLSYAAYPPTCIIGPFFEYKDYSNFIEFKGRYKKNIPFSFFHALMKAAVGLGCFRFLLVLSEWTDQITGKEKMPDFMATEKFGELPFYLKVSLASLV